MDRNRGFDINALRQQLEDLFEDFFPAGGSRRPAGGRGDQGQHLPVSIVEAEDAYVLTAPLPGFEPDDIEINVRGQNLNLRAQRKNPPSDRPNFLRREWGFGPFHRTVDLPGPVDAEHAAAGFKYGVVTITIPKAERPRTIPVDGDEPSDEDQRDEAPETAETPDVAEAPEVEEAAGQEAGTEITVTETSEAAPQADAAADPDAAGRGGRSFYMRPAQGGRRQGRSGQRGGQPPVAAPEPIAPIEPDEKPFEREEERSGGFEAPGGTEPEYEVQAAFDEETESPQEPVAGDQSPVPHTTTASDDVMDLSDLRGPNTDSFASTESDAEPEADAVTDDQDARLSQTTSEPTD